MDFESVVSQLTIEEARRGDPDAARRRLQVLTGIPLLDLTPEAFHLAEQFLDEGALPARAKDDALHLALCSVHEVPYLLTWNFRHLANARIREVLSGICVHAGYGSPVICTPDELMKR